MRIMKNLIAAVLLVIIAFPINCVHAEANLPFHLGANWSKNDVVRYSMVQANNANGLINSCKAKITISVVEKNEEGYILKWRYDEIFQDTYLNKNLSGVLFNFLVNVKNGLEVRYVTDKNGAFKRVINTEELMSKIDRIKQEMTDDEKKPDAVKIMNSVKNEELVNIVIARDIGFFHNAEVYGQKFEMGELYTGDTTLPNPYDPQHPFRGKLTILGTRSPTLNQLEENRHLDKERSAKLIIDALKKAYGVDLDNSLISGIEIQDTLKYSIRKNDSWINSCSFTRKNSFLDRTSSETLEITRIYY